MELRQLRYFVAVARERNFTRAAEQLHIAQPPLSRQVQQLEEELGVQLLVRTGRPLRLTDAGRVFHEQAREILARVEQMKTATRRAGRSERSVLTIGFVASTLYSGLPLLVRRLRRDRPELDIQLLEMMSNDQIEELKNGRIDVGFGRVRATDPGVERIVMREERLVVALPPTSPLARATGPLPMSAIAGENLIVYPKEPRPSFADQVISLLADQGLRPPEIHEVRELQAALGLVAADIGACVIPSSVRTLRTDLCYRDLSDENATSPIIMSYRANDSSAEIALIKQLIAQMYAEEPVWLHPDRAAGDAIGGPAAVAVPLPLR